MKKLVVLGAAALAVTLSTTAFAGSKIVPTSGTTLRVQGAVEANVNNNRDPFIAQVYSRGGECLRLAVFSQPSDLEATIVSPTGTTWQDDDSNGSNRPLVKAITDTNGWYTVIISHYSDAVVNGNVVFDVLRTGSSASVCASPTRPLVQSGAAAFRRVKP